jgi:tRNA-dihydrouridine synthase A
MMDWSDRHYRYFIRQICAQARLYTEMITTGALIHGDVDRHLAFSAQEHPLALQLGGSEPDDLAQCARLGAGYGYDEINLNVGCPSERVQRGAFGACLMAEPQLVAACVSRIRSEVQIPVTVKHRIGVDAVEDYGFLRDFVGALADAGCRTFIVHARNAVLKGLSPKENREIPPLKYDYVHRLKRDFPQLEIVINGGITSRGQIAEQLQYVDGVMLGRAAYHDPWLLADAGKTRAGVVERMVEYCQRHRDVPLRGIVRHMLGLYHGAPRARLWRRLLSDAERLRENQPELLLDALEALESREEIGA